MKLMAKAISLWLMFTCSVICEAQEKKKKSEQQARPDLSGTWLMDIKKSRFDNMRSVSSPTSQSTLVIEHREPEIRVKRIAVVDGEERTREFIYFTDGRGEKNNLGQLSRNIGLSGAVESETKWKGTRLVIRGTERLRAFGDLNEINFTEKWELSADGKTLTQTTTYDILRSASDAPGDVMRDSPSRPARIGSGVVVIEPADSKRVYIRMP